MFGYACLLRGKTKAGTAKSRSEFETVISNSGGDFLCLSSKFFVLK